MKTLFVGFSLLLALSSLYSLPTYVLGGVGYASNTGEMIWVMGVPTAWLHNGLPGGFYGKLISSSKGYPNGTHTDDPPFDWWVPTGEELWDQHIIHIGYMIPVKKLTWLSIAPYIGFGYKNTHTQYRSTASGLWFYTTSTKDRSDYGVDLNIFYKHAGVFIGTSRQFPLQIGITAGF